jgi:hypothetical protein
MGAFSAFTRVLRRAMAQSGNPSPPTRRSRIAAREERASILATKSDAPQVGFPRLAAPHAPTIPRCWDKSYFSAAVRWNVTVGVNTTAPPANFSVYMPNSGSSANVIATVVAGFCI